MEERGVDLGTGMRVERGSARQRVEIGLLVNVGRAELGREIGAAIG